MATKNDVTGDAIKSKSQSDAYAKGWDAIFGKKAEPKESEKVIKKDAVRSN